MTRRIVVVLLGMVASSLLVADVVMIIALPRTAPVSDVYGFRGSGAVLGMALVIVGAAIALRQPRNNVGWIFLVCGTFAPFLDSEYGAYALVERGGALPGGEWAMWLGELALCITLGPISTYMLLVFPNGQLPSRRWRPVAWYTVTALLVWTAAVALVFPWVGHAPAVRNPVSLGLAIDLDESGQRLIASVLVAPAATLCAAGFVHRSLRSRGVERQQLKWVAYAASILVGSLVFLPVTFGRKPLEIAIQVSFVAVPVAAAIAILRYRLYDIDVLINRTLVYGSLTVMLGLVYVVTVLASQQLLRGLTAGSDIAVAGSTLLVVALFQPVRERVQGIVDRRFYRARYDATRTVNAFVVRLRDEVELYSVRADLLEVVNSTIHPAHASVWLRSARR